MNNRYRTISSAAIATILLSFALSGCNPPPGTRGTHPNVKIGEPAFPFTLNLTNSGTATLDTFKDKPIVITFMSSWCPCSNESAPVFKEVYNKYHPQGVEFLMIGIQDKERKFKKFLDKQEFPFQTGFDKGDKIAMTYGVNAPPTTFFITRDGRIKSAFYGRILEAEKLSKWVEEIL
ncbi:MAG: TlpA family protein disulfide reductase [Deltaproteobacteria bacterium]|nr:TlpA family protein disulfide reductase [Deltaproteobacteria bacterium]